MEENNKILLATPVHNSASSVFLTPPLSDKPNKTADMVSQKLPRIQNLILLTPPSPEKTENDIVTSFYLRGFPLILEKIFGYLSQADVTSCAVVCTRWRLFCTNLQSIASRLPAKEKPSLKHREKENQFLKRTSKKQSDRRFPLFIRNSNVMSQQAATPPSISEIKRTKCPNCSSPAKQYNLVHAECCSCTHTFCPRCLGKAHTSNKGCGSRSPTKRDLAELTIGTKQSKKRLKRL